MYSALRAQADSLTDFGLLGEQRSPRWEILCPGCRWTTVQNLTQLALLSVEKSVTVQTIKNKITNSKRYIFTPCLSACVDKNQAWILKKRQIFNSGCVIFRSARNVAEQVGATSSEGILIYVRLFIRCEIWRHLASCSKREDERRFWRDFRRHRCTVRSFVRRAAINMRILHYWHQSSSHRQTSPPPSPAFRFVTLRSLAIDRNPVFASAIFHERPRSEMLSAGCRMCLLCLRELPPRSVRIGSSQLFDVQILNALHTASTQATSCRSMPINPTRCR